MNSVATSALRILALFAAGVTAAAAGVAEPAVGAGATPGGAVQLPPLERIRLDNGAEILMLPRHETPLISMSVLVRGGSLTDPAGREGATSLLADLMQKGAGPRDARAFAETIEAVGGAIGISASTEALTIGASFLARDAGLMIDLVRDAVLSPRLASGEFEKARTLAIQSIAAARDSDPRALIGAYGDAWLFRGQAFGRPVDGSEQSLAAVTLGDVERLHGQHVRGDRLIIVIVGDFEPAALGPRLAAEFSSLPRAESALPVVTPAPRVEGRRVLLVDKPGATQTYFWLGNVGASRTDPERTVQTVVNTVFGGRFTSMLNTELRVKSGLTYGASSGFDRLSQPGAFRISSYTATETTAQAVDLALATLDRLHADGLDAAALESAQAYLLGQFPPTLETNGQLAGRLADLAFHGLGVDEIDQFASRVLAVDADDVKQVIARSFPKSADLAIVLIGDAARIRDEARRLGPVTEMKISDPRFAPE